MTEKELIDEAIMRHSEVTTFLRGVKKSGKVNCKELSQAMEDSRKGYLLLAKYGVHVSKQMEKK